LFNFNSNRFDRTYINNQFNAPYDEIKKEYTIVNDGSTSIYIFIPMENLRVGDVINFRYKVSGSYNRFNVALDETSNKAGTISKGMMTQIPLKVGSGYQEGSIVVKRDVIYARLAMGLFTSQVGNLILSDIDLEINSTTVEMSETKKNELMATIKKTSSGWVLQDGIKNDKIESITVPNATTIQVLFEESLLYLPSVFFGQEAAGISVQSTYLYYSASKTKRRVDIQVRTTTDGALVNIADIPNELRLSILMKG